jgi:PAS domain S-box-containing protein
MESDRSPENVQVGVSEPRYDPAALFTLAEGLENVATADHALLESVFRLVPTGVMLFDVSGNLQLQNPAAERIWAGSATLGDAQAWGKYRAFHPDGRGYDVSDWYFMRCVKTSQAVRDEEISIQRFDGSRAVLLATAVPLFDRARKLTGALAIFSDVTRIKQFEVAEQLRAERMLRIQGLTAQLAAALTSEEIAERIVDQATVALGAKSGALWLSEGERVATLLRQTGYTEQAALIYARIPLDGETPLSDSMRRREPLFTLPAC